MKLWQWHRLQCQWRARSRSHTLTNHIIQLVNVRWNSFECKFYKIILAAQYAAHRSSTHQQRGDEVYIDIVFFFFHFFKIQMPLHSTYDSGLGTWVRAFDDMSLTCNCCYSPLFCITSLWTGPIGARLTPYVYESNDEWNSSCTTATYSFR